MLFLEHSKWLKFRSNQSECLKTSAFGPSRKLDNGTLQITLKYNA